MRPDKGPDLRLAHVTTVSFGMQQLYVILLFMGNTDLLNYYEILEVPQHASQSDIQYAYEKARSIYSLDNPTLYKIFTSDEAQAWLQIVNEAFQVIGHPQTRAAYNQEFSSHQRIVPADLSQFQAEELRATPEALDSEANPSAPNAQLPDGHGQTPLSTYLIQKSMEDYIDKEEIFDGLFLKKIRTYKNVEPQDFSGKTCIALRHIYAIENNNFSVLPATVFVRGYIQQYCRILNLDEERVVPSFMSLLANEKNTHL